MSTKRRPRRNVSPGRKSLHKTGLMFQVIGGVGVVACFIGFALAGMAEVESGWGSPVHPIVPWIGFVLFGAMVALGGFMRNVATRGAAGSGLVLDPERARDDLEPWARMGGGLAKDALDETGLLESKLLAKNDAEPVVKVRCAKCRTLNDEHAKFCDECGAKI